MTQTLYILHFQPLEGYPPIMNILDYFSLKNKFQKIVCITTKGKLKPIYTNSNIDVKRKGNVNKGKGTIWLSYFIFNLSSTLSLLIKRPRNVIYYETISSFPAYFYKTYINKKANIYIHYHEYATKSEYNASSIINRYLHKKEQKIYSDVEWISHTNQTRLTRFLEDNNISQNDNKHFTLPNYPSEKWGIKNTPWNEIGILKFILVGYAIDPKSTFITELIEWLANQKIKTSITIYCLKQESLPKNLIGKKGNTYVNIHNSVSYYQLPHVLKKYHIGLILYKGLTPNSIYIAPNKLFEYLACGLDVWFPKEIKGCYSYEADSTPKIVKLDFNNLKKITLSELITTSSKKTSSLATYNCENVYLKFLDNILINSSN